jgi:cytosine/adenosine deaminase-related metal-dependent hydrolase
MADPVFPLERLQRNLEKPRNGRSLGEHLRRQAGIDGAKVALLHEVLDKPAMQDMARVVITLKRLPLRLVRPRPMAETISTAGGVRLEGAGEEIRVGPEVKLAAALARRRRSAKRRRIAEVLAKRGQKRRRIVDHLDLVEAEDGTRERLAYRAIRGRFEEEIAAATKAAGLRAVLGQTIIQFPVADAKTWQDGLSRAELFVHQWRDDALITPAYAPHSMYTLDEPALLAIRASAAKTGAFTLIHLSETRVENEDSKKNHGASPTAYLERLGFWAPRTLAAHGVWLDDADLAILAKRGVGLSHNPESNMKLASGTAPVTGYLRAGVALGLGTDGAASNNDLDMFEAMRTASLLAKLQTSDPSVVPAATALDMATMGGARALGLAGQIGSIEPKKRADLIVVSMRSARQTPLYDAISHLVYTTRGDDVRDTIVNGKVVMRDRKVLTLDAEAVLRDARAMAVKVRAAVK